MPADTGYWTGPRIEQLTKLALAGKMSAAQIANELGGCSRNAVLGKIHRLRLIFTKPDTPPRVRREPKLRIAYVNGHSNQMRITEWIPADQVELRCAEIVPRNLALEALEPNDCRFPYDDGPFTFCGHPQREGSSYCTAHYSLTRVCTRPVLSREEILAKRNAYTRAYRAAKRAEAMA
jgi:GcrA cell cycle regulator